MAKARTDLPSMKLKDLLADRDQEQPIPYAEMTLEQRCVLKSYWRSNTVRFVGGIVTLRLVSDHAQDDYGYGTVNRGKVEKVLHELIEQGWEINVSDLGVKKSRTARTETVINEPEPKKTHRPTRRLESTNLSSIDGELPQEDQLVGPDTEPKITRVKRATP